MKNIEEYQKFIYLGLIVIAIGIIFTTSLKETVGSFGNVLVAVGGLLFIIGMSKKQKGTKGDEGKNPNNKKS